MATAQAIATERSAAARWQWIISAPEDLLCLGMLREIGLHQLECEQLAEPLMANQQHAAHAARAELLNDLVAPGDHPRGILDLRDAAALLQLEG